MNTISNLGRIIFLLLFTNILCANISVTVDKKLFYKGDTVTLQIKATGDDIEFPNLKDIAGFPIVDTSASEQIYVVNGKTTRGKIVNYMFVPSHSIVIPSFIVKINGGNFKTNPIPIKQTIPQVSKEKDDIVLLLETNKDKVYVGEAIIATVIFKYKVGINLIDAKLEPFKPNNFWVKGLKGGEPKEENGYMVYKSSFLVFPQKSGNLRLENQLISVALKDVNSYDIKQFKVFSNDQIIKVLPLSSDLSVQGEYTINATVDKTETSSNEPTNLTITINGLGNIDDIEEFKLDLPNQVVYSSKPIISSGLIEKNYGGTFTQKISIISDKSFTIPSLHFQYFDKLTKKIVDIDTSSFFIKVINKKTIAAKTIEQKENGILETYNDKNIAIKYVYGFLGILVGSLISFALIKRRDFKREPKERPFEIKIKKAKSDKELYDLLLPYSQKQELKIFIKDLEENIYFGATNTINKKELLLILSNEIEDEIYQIDRKF